MNDLHKAAQQALEAWQSHQHGKCSLEKAVERFDALKAALAQQAEPQDAELSAALGWPGGISEPVLDRKTLLRQVADLRAALAQKDETTPPPLQAEPVEPVAWHYTNNGGCNVMHWGPSARLDADIQAAKDYPRVHKVTPLYIAPPQRLPLTEREILEAVGWERAEMWMKLAPNFPVDEARKETIKNARAVEKAVWEKNHGQA